MANMERLTKRVTIMEKWIEENKDVGGPAGTLDTVNYLIHETRRNAQEAHNTQQAMQQFRSFAFEFLTEHKLTEEWDEFVQEKENAVQKQQTEEIPLQEEAESGEESVEAPVEEKEG
jgi:hypothetical protein